MNESGYAFFKCKESTRMTLIEVIGILKKGMDILMGIICAYVLFSIWKERGLEISIGSVLRYLSVAVYKISGLGIIMYVLEYFEYLLILELPNGRGKNVPIFAMQTVYTLLEIILTLVFIIPNMREIAIRTLMYDYTLGEYISLFVYYFFQYSLLILIVLGIFIAGIKKIYINRLIWNYKNRQ